VITSNRAVAAALWTVAVVLAFIGVLASFGRGVSVMQLLQSEQRPRPELSRFDSLNIVNSAPIYGARAGSAEFQTIERDTRRFTRKFSEYPGATLLHILPAALFMLLAPFQFSRSIRARHIRVHRWSGRLLVALAIPIGVSALFFGLFMPFSGVVEASAIGFFGGLFLFSVAQAFIAIRRRDVARHREWMIRMLGIALGVSTVRLVGIALALLTREGPHVWFGLSVWLGFALTLAVAELWIRGTRPRAVPELAPAPVTGS